MADEMEIRFVGDLQRVQVQPNDRFVLTVDQVLSASQAEAIQRAWAKFMAGDDVPLLVCPKGARLDVWVEKAKG